MLLHLSEIVSRISGISISNVTAFRCCAGLCVKSRGSAWRCEALQSMARRGIARAGLDSIGACLFHGRRVDINITTECAAHVAVRCFREDRTEAICPLSFTVHSRSRGRDNKDGGFTTRMSCGLFLADSYEPSAEDPRVLWLTIRAHSQSRRGNNTDGGDSKCDARRAVRTSCHPGRTDAACTRNSAIGHVVPGIGTAQPARRPDGNGCPEGLCICERFRKIG